MGLFDTFKAELHLTMTDKVVKAGGSLRGYVTLKVTKPLPFRSLRLEITGVESCAEYVESTYYGGVPGGYLKEATHLVFDELITLAGHTKHSHEESKLEAEAGQYNYPFEVLLPANLPPTHAGYPRRLWGHSVDVKYMAKVVLDIPSSLFTAHAEEVFTVVVPTPKHQAAEAHAAVGEHTFTLKDKENNNKGDLTSKVSLDRTLVVPSSGDAMKVKCEIDNTKGVDPVTGIVLGLTLDAHLRIDGYDARETMEKAHAHVVCNVPVGEKQTIETELVIPADLWCSYPGLSACISHHVIVGFEVPHCAKPFHKFPIVVIQEVDEADACAETRWREPSPYTIVKPGLEYAWAVPQRPVVEAAPLGAGVRESDVPPMPWKGQEEKKE